MSRFTLALVRHGVSVGNEQNFLCGWTDVPLAEKGRASLRELVSYTRYPATDRYYSSDLTRCMETFGILYEGKAKLDGLLPAFREINFGSFEGKTASEVDFPVLFKEWLLGRPVSDVEPRASFSGRVLRAATELCDECLESGAKSATVLTHSGVIRSLLIQLGRLETRTWFALPTPNGLGYSLEIDCAADSLRLLSVSAITSNQ